MKGSLFILLIATALVCDALKIAELTRKIDLTDYNTVIEIEATLENDAASDVSSFELAFTSGSCNVAWIEGIGCSASLATRRVESGVEYYKVNLNTPVKKGQESTITVTATVVRQVVPVPNLIAQDEHQYVVYSEPSQTIKLAYPIASQKTVVILPSKSVLLSEEDKADVKQDGEKLTYGPFEEKQASKPLRVHYEFNGPMVVIDKLEKEVYVSHWSGVTFEESYWLHHAGAGLKEGFSRYDYQHNPGHSGISSVRSLRRNLPLNAADAYYRDTIGNISTSNMKSEGKHQVIEMRPRFPLFGGWKTEFYMGYIVPLADVVSSAEGKYVASFPLGSVFESTVVDHAIVRVVLPEGATGITVSCKYPGVISDVINGDKVVMLDITSSPYVEFTAKNLVPRGYNDRVLINVTYSYNTMNMYRAPAIILALLAGVAWLVLRKK